MIDSTGNISSIPPIGSSQIWLNQSENKKPDVSLFDNAPNDVTLGSFFGKFIIWFGKRTKSCDFTLYIKSFL